MVIDAVLPDGQVTKFECCAAVRSDEAQWVIRAPAHATSETWDSRLRVRHNCPRPSEIQHLTILFSENR